MTVCMTRLYVNNTHVKFTHDFICSPNSRHGLIHVVKFEFYRAIQSHGKVCGGWGGSEDVWVWNIFSNWVLHLK